MAIIVVDCVDKRMPEVLPKILAKIGASGKAYHNSATGCSLGLDHEYDHIGKMIGLTGANEIYLFDHLRCKRYEEKYGKLSLEKEREMHLQMLQKRASELRERFPKLSKIHLCLLTNVTEEAIGVDFEEILAEDNTNSALPTIPKAAG